MPVVMSLHYQVFVTPTNHKLKRIFNVRNLLKQVKELQEIVFKWKIIYFLFFIENKLIQINFLNNNHICISLFCRDMMYCFFFPYDIECPSIEAIFPKIDLLSTLSISYS